MLNGKRSSTQAPNIRGVVQCSTSTLTIKDVVQHKRQLLEVFWNRAPRNFRMKDAVQYICEI